ncbi:MAG: hypothetical protein LBJ00_03150 [Planctomycetaceae bacterium]|nr:hypothetical protein [Planctomycetaceae bacterium]
MKWLCRDEAYCPYWFRYIFRNSMWYDWGRYSFWVLFIFGSKFFLFFVLWHPNFVDSEASATMAVTK